MSPRLSSLVRALLIISLLALAVLVLQLASRPAAAFTPPPADGNWEINDTTTWSSGVVLRGNLIVQSNGILVLNGANITFLCTQIGQYRLEVLGGGTLQADNAAISAWDVDLPFSFKIYTGASVELRGCTIKGVGAFASTMDTWGIYVHSSNATISNCRITQCNVGIIVHGFVSPTITGNNISGNRDRGIWCKYSSPFLGNNRISDNSYGLYIENDSFPALLNNEFQNNRKDALYMTPGCLVDWKISQPCSWVNSTMTMRGNLSVESGGILRMQGSDLGMAVQHSGLIVRSGGQLVLTGSSLTATGGSDAYSFATEAGGSLDIDSSTIKNVGWSGANLSSSGIYIAGQGRISASSLAWNQASLICEKSSVTVTNSTLGGTWLDLRMDNSTVRFVNVSYNPSKAQVAGAASVLEVGWYLSAGAVWQNGNGVSGAALTVRYVAGAVLFDGETPDGWARWLVVVQRRVTPTGTADTANVSLLAKRQGFDDISRTVQVASNLEERMVFIDPAPPALSISSPADGLATNQTRVQVRGNASDNVGLDAAEYSLDDFPRWTRLSAGEGVPFITGEWSIVLANLSKGQHRLSVRAVDLAGLATYANLTFMVDTEAPKLELDEPYDESLTVNVSSVRFRGTTEPGARLLINGSEVPLAADGTFDAAITLAEGTNQVKVVAQDRAGNAVSLNRRITVDITPPSIIIFSPPPGFRTNLPEVQLVGRIEPGARFRIDGSTITLAPDGGFNETVLLSGGPKTLELYAEDAAGNSNTTTFTMDRQLEPTGGGGGFMERYGLYLGVGAMAVIALAAGAAIALRRRKRKKAPPAPRSHPPVSRPPAGEPEEAPSADEILYAGKGSGGPGEWDEEPPGADK